MDHVKGSKTTVTVVGMSNSYNKLEMNFLFPLAPPIPAGLRTYRGESCLA